MNYINYKQVPYTIDGNILKTKFTYEELKEVYNFFAHLTTLQKYNREQFVIKNISKNIYNIIEDSFSDFVYNISLFSDYNEYGKKEFLENVETVNKQSVSELHNKLKEDLKHKDAEEIQHFLDNPGAYNNEFLYAFES